MRLYSRLRQGRSDGRLQACLSLLRRYRSDPFVLLKDNWEAIQLVQLLLSAERGDEASKLLSLKYQNLSVKITFSSRHPGDMTVSWAVKEKCHHFEFGAVFLDQHGIAIVARWLALLPILMLVNDMGGLLGTLIINLGDAGDRNGLAFCESRAEYELIPDSDFLSSEGYKNQADFYKNIYNTSAWCERSSDVFWRGSANGISNDGVFGLSRVKMCKLLRNVEGFDVGLTDLYNLASDESKKLNEAGLLKQYEPWTSLCRYKFHIDIDGNSNAWSGLFLKLLSGGLVFKVSSQYQQWYYHLLKPWVHFVPIASDLSDMIKIIRFVTSNQRLSESIATQGLALAQSLDYSSQVKSAAENIIGYDAKLSSLNL